MKPTFLSILARELRLLTGDPLLLSMVSWVPVSLYLIMWLIFCQGVATNIPMGIVDLDNSQISRGLIRQYDASPSITIDKYFISVAQGKEQLQAGKIYGLVVIPDNFEKDVIVGRPPQVTAFVNTQFLLTGKVINSALLEAQTTYSTKVDVVKNMTGHEPVFSMALSAARPIGSQITPLFNSNKDYAQFLLAAIMPAIWQILMVITCILSLAREQREHGLAGWLGETPFSSILAKMVVLGFLFLLSGMFFLYWMYIYLGWPMHGSWPILLYGQILTIIASISMAFLFFLIIKDPARSISVAAAYVAPALAFMGVTFPITDMTFPARAWRSMLPICHYIEIQIGQVNYAAPLQTVLPKFITLSLFFIPLTLVFLLAIKITTKPLTTQGEAT